MTKSNSGIRMLNRLGLWLFAACALTSASAATVYISPGGNNSCNGSSQALGSSGSCAVKSFSRAFSLMSGGDTLILLNGTYQSSTTGLIGPTDIPNGTSKTNMTTLRGLNGAGFVRYSGKLTLGDQETKAKFIRLEGLLISTADDTESGMTLQNVDYIYVKNCGVRDFGNRFRPVLGVGSNDHNQGNTNVLIEDSWIWGKNKQVFNALCSDRVVLRRVLVRHDGCSGGSFCTGSGNSSYAVGAYSSAEVSFQNVINIDRILAGSRKFAAFAGINQSSVCYNQSSKQSHHIEYYGSVAFNSEDHAFLIDLSTNSFSKPTYTTKNSVAWKVADGLGFGANCSNCSNADWTMSGATSGLTDSYNYGKFDMTVATDSALAYMTNGDAVNFNYTPTDSLAFNSGFEDGCSGDCLTSNPTVTQSGFSNPCLKYPMRVEANSACKGTGVGGEDIGANVVGYGLDGTYYGENGYDSERDFATTWPFPNEDLIKKQVCGDDVQGRGWCADFASTANPGKTLTQYLWEDLGNSCPDEICQGDPIDPDSPPPAPDNVQRLNTH